MRPTLQALREAHPGVRVTISLIPCQFASGSEARIASAFGADAVTTPSDFLRFLATSKRGPGLQDAWRGGSGVVISMGGNTALALKLAGKLGYAGYRYSFNPYWHRQLKRLFLPDERAAKRARLLGAPKERVEVIGNLVADAVQRTAAIDDPGEPHLLLIPGSRDGFALHLIPFMIALTERLGAIYPNARFIWPVSRLLSDQTLEDGIAGKERATLGGLAGKRIKEDGVDVVLTPSGHALELVPESLRYAHMRAADLAITIPGTNTLELGVAGVPSVVILPLNKPEAIPLEGPGHWLSLVPLIGTALKRQAVLLAAPRFPVSLPNSLSGENLMLELKGKIDPQMVVEGARALLDDPERRSRIKERLRATMPQPGAAERLVSRVLKDM